MELPLASGSPMHLDAFLWCTWVADVLYVVMACVQRWRMGAYPAVRHQVDVSSWLILGSHMASGLLVIYGGAALWMAARLWSILPLWAVQMLAVAALVHSFTNLGLLRKVAGIRTITVPLYIVATAYNTVKALNALSDPSFSSFILLWTAVSTYIWVRLYLMAIGMLLTGWAQQMEARFDIVYDSMYTQSLPLAGVMGILLPSITFGNSPYWAVLFGSFLPLAPCLMAVHKVLRLCQESLTFGKVFPFNTSAFQFCLDTVDPVRHHGQTLSSDLWIPVLSPDVSPEAACVSAHDVEKQAALC